MKTCRQSELLYKCHFTQKIHLPACTPQARELAASDWAETDSEELRAQLDGQRSLLDEVSSAARELATENETLNYEVTGLRDANRNLGNEVTAMKV